MPGTSSSFDGPARRVRRVVAALAAVIAAACGTSGDRGHGLPMREPEPEKSGPAPGVEAVLAPVGGSAAQGSAKFLVRGDGVTAFIVVNNVVPGPYRVAIHERGNCSSPNGFSAGKPWAPPGSPRPASDILPEIPIGQNGNGVMTASIRGLKLAGPDSLEGRSVVVHAGSTVDAIVVPDRPNRIVLCGVIGPVRSFRDALNFL